MRFENSDDVFIMKREMFSIIVMDMLAAGRMEDPEASADKITHGTAKKPHHNCPFIVFDVPATNWAGAVAMIRNGSCSSAHSESAKGLQNGFRSDEVNVQCRRETGRSLAVCLHEGGCWAGEASAREN
jgi:hypothetical protein